MRILFVTQTYPRFAGDTAGPFIRDLALGLARRGHALTVLLPHAADVAPAWTENGVVAQSVRYAPEALERIGYGRSLRTDERLRGLAAATAPLYALAMRRALGAMLRGGRFDLVHAHWIVPNGLIATAAAAHTHLAVGLHGSDVFLAERSFLRPLVKRLLRRTELLTGCSPELVRRVVALGFEAERSRVIPYGVDADLYHPDQERRLLWRRRLGLGD
ncbi:MAG TPA: glycosyltransferase, partial [Thermoanaerobaculia bacterium]|nr:glycosyltransferase [Thermoanaerobaculia bacterium]